MTDMYDLLIIGGGPAGVTAALRARELGATAALVERGPLGGACTNDGCVPTRFLAHAARLVRNAAEYEDYGLSGPAPRVDLAQVMECARAMVERIHGKKAIRGHLINAGVDVFERAGTASFLDPHTIRLKDRALKGRNVLICAGGHARRLPIVGGNLTLTHSDVWRMTKLPSKLLVIGGAATGCQLASIFAAFGSHVTLAETAVSILGNEDPDVAGEVARAFRARGIDVLTETSVTEVQELSGSRRRVLMTSDGDHIERDFDAVIAAVGWTGNVDDLNLAEAGVKAERGYITVDRTLRTSMPHIWAAGDIIGRMMLVQCAGEEGLAAAENALLQTERGPKHAVVPHGGFTDPEYGSVGSTESEAREAGDIVVACVPYRDIDRAVIDGRPEGFCKIVVDRESRRIVGAHVVGQQAVEIVQVAAAAMQSNAVIDDLARLEYAYPTFTTAIGLAARQILRQLGDPAEMLRWRTLGMNSGAAWETAGSNT